MGRLGQTYTFGGFRLDTNRRILSALADGQTIPLSTPAFDTLRYLIEHAGDLVERKALLAAVWPHVTVVENSVNQIISTLRRALGDDADAPRFVSTVQGRGYRFLAQVIPEDAATRSAEAYQFYAAGWSALTRPSGGKLAAALDLLKQAIVCDPGFALAHAHLADGYAMACVHGLMPAQEAIPLLRQAAECAMKADPALPEAHVARARLQELAEQDFAAALASLDHAIELDPLCFTAYRYKGIYLTNFGKFDEALAALRKAQTIQPLAVYIGANIGMVLYYARRYPEAIAQFELVLRMEPDQEIARAYLGRTLLQMGQAPRAIRELEQGTKSLRAHASNLPVAWAMAGETDRARAALAEILKDPKAQPIDAARIHAVLGEPEEAITWLERAVAVHSPGLFSVDPNFWSLHGHPRFQALVDRLGFRMVGPHDQPGSLG
jgi:DNA-binding winged helix-turn-helix (wHTH) protein/Tfp pilus assembly protein PilF